MQVPSGGVYGATAHLEIPVRNYLSGFYHVERDLSVAPVYLPDGDINLLVHEPISCGLQQSHHRCQQLKIQLRSLNDLSGLQTGSSLSHWDASQASMFIWTLGSRPQQ